MAVTPASGVDDTILSPDGPTLILVLRSTADLTDYSDLALLLGLSPADIQRIEDDEHKAKDKKKACLQEWLNRGNASWAILVSALRDPLVNKGAIANDIAKNRPKISPKLPLVSSPQQTSGATPNLKDIKQQLVSIESELREGLPERADHLDQFDYVVQQAKAMRSLSLVHDVDRSNSWSGKDINVKKEIENYLPKPLSDFMKNEVSSLQSAMDGSNAGGGLFSGKQSSSRGCGNFLVTKEPDWRLSKIEVYYAYVSVRVESVRFLLSFEDKKTLTAEYKLRVYAVNSI